MGCSPSKATVTPTTKPLPPISKSDEGKGRKSVNQRKSVIQKSGQQSIAYEIPVEGQGKKNTLPKIMSPEALKAKLEKSEQDQTALRQKLLLKDQKAEERRQDQMNKFREKMARKEENSKKVVERKKANLDDGIVFDEDDEGDKKEWNRNWNGNESSHPHRRKSTQVNHGHGGHGKDQIKKKIK